MEIFGGCELGCGRVEWGGMWKRGGVGSRCCCWCSEGVRGGEGYMGFVDTLETYWYV